MLRWYSLANIEQWAIDLAWDVVARFGRTRWGPQSAPLPREFFQDYVRIAYEESTHFGCVSYMLVFGIIYLSRCV